MVKYALVLFLTGKDRKHVVPVKDIKDFKPRSVEDFDPKKEYQVLYPVLRRENSDTTELPYAAHILLLAASSQSMVIRAKAASISLPVAFKNSVGKPRANNHGKSLEDAVTMAHRASKRTKRQVNSALIASCKQRMAVIANVEQEVKSADASRSTDSTQSSKEPDNTSKNNDIQSSGLISTEPGGSSKNNELPILMEPNVNTEPDESDRGDGPPVKKPRKRKGSEASSNSTGSYESSRTELEKLQQALDQKQEKYNDLYKENILLKSSLGVMEMKLEKWKTAFAVFQQQVTPSGPGSAVSTPKHTNNFIVAPLIQEDKSPLKKGLSEARRNLFEVKCLSDISADKPSSAPDPVGLESSTPLHKQTSVKLVKTPSKPDTPMDDVEASAELNESPASPSKPSVTPVKMPSSLKSKSPRKKIVREKGQKSKELPALETGEMYNWDLFKPLVAALKGEQDLPEKQVTIAGKKTFKQVDIGNKTFIKKDLWESKIIKPQVKLSIIVRDLAEEVWGFKQCAKMSLAGGKSPKTPQAEIKPQAPRGNVEAILAVVRAKKYLEGMTIKEHLDEFICTSGEKFLRDKFKDSADKLKKHLKQVEQLAA